MLVASNVCKKLKQLNDVRHEIIIIYDEPSYEVTKSILTLSRGANLTEEEREFDKRMSKVRVFVDWGFGKICNYFAYLDL